MSADEDAKKSLKVQLKNFTLPAPDADLQAAFKRLNPRSKRLEESDEAAEKADFRQVSLESDDEEGAAGGQSG